MKTSFFVGSVLLSGVLISFAAVAKPAAAQGPAGAGASTAVQDSSHSLNPIRWLKKDSKNSADTLGDRSDIEKKLTPSLQTEGVLAADVTATDACAPFTELDECLAALHASHNLKLDFYCLRAGVTGVHTTADLSGCKIPDEGKAQGLNRAIHTLKPDVSAKQATKDAEQQARDDLKGIGQ